MIKLYNIFYYTFILTLISYMIFDLKCSSNDIKANGLPMAGKTVIIDAGHGGWDPGEVVSFGKKEAELNLEIARKLQQYIESSGGFVIITRADEHGLYSSDAKNKKLADFTERLKIINNSYGSIYVSIHQNSFKDPIYKGAQVFYYDTTLSKELASSIQEELKKQLDNTNKRDIKTGDYYLLKNSKIPAVIVECGFLSNYAEAKNLNDDTYQEKVAFSIYSGISNYFNNEYKCKTVFSNIGFAYAK